MYLYSKKVKRTPVVRLVLHRIKSPFWPSIHKIIDFIYWKSDVEFNFLQFGIFFLFFWQKKRPIRRGTKKVPNTVRFFIVNFDINYITLKFDFLNICKISSEKFLWLKNYNFSFINSTQPNLNHSFINLNSNVTKYDFKTKKCLSNCSYCKYKYEFSSLNFNTFFFPTYTNSCCQLEKCVYILICIKCNCFYIGQTSKCFKQRLYQHLNNIKNFEPIVKQISEISTHFNLKNHNKNDLRFLIFKSDLDDSERYSIENDLINIFINLKLKILNEKIPNQFFIKKFSFN